MFKLLILVLISREVWSANILMVGLTVSHSHHYWMETVSMGLIDKGHNITFLSLDPTKLKRDNYTVITLDGIYEHFAYGYTSDELQQITFTPLTIPPFVDFLFDFMLDVCKKALHHPKIHTLLSYPKNFKFDLIIWDHTMGECMYPLIQHFGYPPTIGVSPYGLSDTVESIYGGHVYSYVGNVCMPFAEASTLWQRLINIIYINYNIYRRNTYYKQKYVETSKKVFWDWDLTKFERVEENFNLVLLNWNVALNQPQALSPNMIPVGGVQIKKGEKLPKDIENIFAKPSSGVIFFSLGSNSKSESLSTPILQSFAQCFAELSEYQIIWKITPPASLKLPSNVNTVSWAPQTAILAQPKTKLFITHGGGLSTHETAYFGVPIIGVPIFLDQINNVEKLKTKGGGEVVNVRDMHKSKRSKDIFCQKVKKVLFTEKYELTMKQLSKRYRDTEMDPMDTLTYWAEYVLRHGDAKHLTSLSRNMSIFYSQNLDIYLMFIVFFAVQLYIICAILRCFCRKCCKRARKDKTA